MYVATFLPDEGNFTKSGGENHPKPRLEFTHFLVWLV